MLEQLNYSLRSTNEKLWWSAAKQAEGPYSLRAGPMSVSFCGGVAAFEREHQVDVADLQPGDYSKIYEVVDAEGHTWYCRWVGHPFWLAFRDPTDSEVVECIEASEDAVNLMLKKSAVVAARRIASELSRLAEVMRPERCPSRSERRLLKRRVRALSELQWELLLLRMPGREVRARLEQVGMSAGEIDHQAWLDENYH